MMLPKIKISQHFSRASNSYDAVACVQKQSADFLVEKLVALDRSFYPKAILDVGTGTGYIPEFLMAHYPQAFYTLNDISPRMTEIARLKFAHYDNVVFSTGDMENLAITDQPLIISNFALQWANDLWGTIEKLYHKSCVFAFSCLLDGTFQEWQDILNGYSASSVLSSYPSEQKLVSFCHKLSGKQAFYFWPKDFQLTFSNAFSFMQYLKKLGAGINNNNLPISVLRALIAKHNHELTVTYKILFAILKR